MDKKRVQVVILCIAFLFSGACSWMKRKPAKEVIFSLSDYSSVFSSALKKNHPAVVTIVRRRHLKMGPHSIELESFGSGVLVSDEGHIITNYHNVKKRKPSDMTILLTEDPQRHFKLQVFETDPYNDLALLKIERKRPFPYVPLTAGKHDTVQVGDTVFAIGSSKVRETYLGSIQKGSIVKNNKYIFSDAKVSHGFSGGGLFSSDGKLIGISTKYHRKERVGTAIPLNIILDFLSQTSIKDLIEEDTGSKKASLSFLSDQINQLAETYTPLVVQVVAKPTKKDYERKMMKVSKISKINLHRTENAEFKYWYPASGIILSEDGYILTAYFQVVDNCDDISVTVFSEDGSGTAYPAKVVAFDEDFDVNLALLKIEPKEKLPFVQKDFWRQRKSGLGNLIFTIGNSLHFEQTFTGGIISNFKRGLIQTDAAINNGNLGGPLIDDKGKLAGVIIKREYALNGISLAIPSLKAVSFVERYWEGY